MNDPTQRTMDSPTAVELMQAMQQTLWSPIMRRRPTPADDQDEAMVSNVPEIYRGWSDPM